MLTTALAALATAHNQLGDVAAATACLEALLEEAEARADSASLAEACEKLGILGIQRGDSGAGASFLERAFELRRDMVEKESPSASRADLERTRALLGLARANGRADAFFELVLNVDVKRLLPLKDVTT